MSILVAGVAVFALLVTSYGRRGAWLAGCSTALSLTTFIGLILASTAREPSIVRAHLTTLMHQLDSKLDQATLRGLAAVIAPASGCDATSDRDCAPVKQLSSPVGARHAAAASNKAAKAAQARAIDTASASVEAPGSPLAWLSDPPSVAASSSRLLIGGINRSDEPLRQVRATLKPDAMKREIALRLNVLDGNGDEPAVIPPGAHFTLELEVEPKAIGGAIFAFRYVYAGKQRSSIWYLTPAMLARREPAD